MRHFTNGDLLPEDAALRRQARELLSEDLAQSSPPHSEEDALKLLHELGVYQLELDMQNDELRTARDELELAVNRYSFLYDHARLGFFTLDRNGTIQAANLTGARLLGDTRSQLIGQRIGRFFTIKDRPAFAAFLGQSFSDPEGDCREMTLSMGEHPVRTVEIGAEVDGAGRDCSLWVLDITGRSRSTPELNVREELDEIKRTLAECIESAVEEMRHKEQMAALRERQAALGEMVALIAQQCEPRLQALGLLLKRPPLGADQSLLNRDSLSSADAALELVRNLSATIGGFQSLFGADRQEVQFSVSQVIADTLDLVENFLKDQGVGILFLPEGHPTAKGFPGEFSQILLNIVSYLRNTVTDRQAEEVLITIRAFSEGGQAVVTIADNAGGVPAEGMETLFDRHAAGDGWEGANERSLSMSRTIIEKRMGGSLTAQNCVGGTEFRIEV